MGQEAGDFSEKWVHHDTFSAGSREIKSDLGFIKIEGPSVTVTQRQDGHCATTISGGSYQIESNSPPPKSRLQSALLSAGAWCVWILQKFCQGCVWVWNKFRQGCVWGGQKLYQGGVWMWHALHNRKAEHNHFETCKEKATMISVETEKRKIGSEEETLPSEMHPRNEHHASELPDLRPDWSSR